MTKNIRQATMDDVHGNFKVAYLMGWVTPNGEFISGDNSFMIHEELDACGTHVCVDNIFLEEEE